MFALVIVRLGDAFCPYINGNACLFLLDIVYYNSPFSDKLPVEPQLSTMFLNFPSLAQNLWVKLKITGRKKV